MLADVDPGWRAVLQGQHERLAALGEFLRREVAAGRGYLPGGAQILRAFERSMADVRVVIVGQDPYPTPGHATGLAFSVAPEVQPLPRSLGNIFREYSDDLRLPLPRTGDLAPWTERGVLLLNRVLTVSPSSPGSHRGLGWESITAAALEALASRGTPLVAILWGRDAAATKAYLRDVPCIESAHPSPLSAARGFFGSRPFSRANQLLVDMGASPIDWRLP